VVHGFLSLQTINVLLQVPLLQMSVVQTSLSLQPSLDVHDVGHGTIATKEHPVAGTHEFSVHEFRSSQRMVSFWHVPPTQVSVVQAFWSSHPASSVQPPQGESSL
jgi:hypothetical protein